MDGMPYTMIWPDWPPGTEDHEFVAFAGRYVGLGRASRSCWLRLRRFITSCSDSADHAEAAPNRFFPAATSSAVDFTANFLISISPMKQEVVDFFLHRRGGESRCDNLPHTLYAPALAKIDAD